MTVRVLEFTVDKQRLTRTKGCDFSGIVARSVGYLKAKFHFSKEWDNCSKVAGFCSNGEEYPVVLEDDACMIPAEALLMDNFQVYVLGGKEDGYRIETTRIKVKQEVT